MNNERICSNLACPHIYALHNAYTQYHRAFALQHSGHAILLRVRMKRQRTRNRIACPREKTADTQQNCVSAMLQCECPVVLHVRVMYRVYVRTGKIAAYPLVVHLSYSTQNNTISTCPSSPLLVHITKVQKPPSQPIVRSKSLP